ncbi:MAG: iron export ABC transporter permease subunit FetB [Candidatus Omnitrophota bacterium]
MNSDYLPLSLNQVLASLAMIALAAILARLNRSLLERQYLIGAARSFIQLWLMGYFLLWLFQSNQPIYLALTLELMIIAGAYTSVKRQEKFSSHTFLALWLALHASALTIGGYLFWVVLQVPHPLKTPHLFLPLMGMVIGNSANGAALIVHRLRGELESRRGEIETALALGASPRQALEPYTAAAMRNALIPSINSMMLMGIVQLPGIMTGQLISGILPEKAVRYQIVVVYMLAGAVALACHLTVRWEARSFFTRRWALTLDA